MHFSPRARGQRSSRVARISAPIFAAILMAAFIRPLLAEARLPGAGWCLVDKLRATKVRDRVSELLTSQYPGDVEFRAKYGILANATLDIVATDAVCQQGSIAADRVAQRGTRNASVIVYRIRNGTTGPDYYIVDDPSRDWGDWHILWMFDVKWGLREQIGA